jgi:hypothetical protein
MREVVSCLGEVRLVHVSILKVLVLFDFLVLDGRVKSFKLIFESLYFILDRL